MSLTRKQIGLTLIGVCILSPWLFPALAADVSQGKDSSELQLKPSVPKLDTDSAGELSVLKGGVEHRIHKKPLEAAAKKTKKTDLSGSAANGALQASLKAKQEAERLMRQRASIDSEDRPQSFQYKIDRSIGIIGVKFLKVAEKSPVINRVFPGTPAWNSGLQVDDVIVAVDGVPTYGLTKDECYDLIVGTPNTPVTISIRRHGDFMAKSMHRMDFNDIPDPAVRRDYLRSL